MKTRCASWKNRAVLSALLTLLLLGGMGRVAAQQDGRRVAEPAQGMPPVSQVATRPVPTPAPTRRPAATPTPILPPINPRQFTQSLLITLACLVGLMVGLSLLLTTVVRRLWRRW